VVGAGLIMLIDIISLAIIGTGIFQILFYFTQFLFSYLELRQNPSVDIRYRDWLLPLGDESILPISILIPAYNTESTITATVNSILQLNYPVFEVIVINDGSTDSTSSILIEHYDMHKTVYAYEQHVPHAPIETIYRSKRHKNLLLIEKENGGKADGLNAGITLSRYPLFCAIDSDSLLERDALLRMAHPFVENPDTLIAAGGAIRVVNACSVKNGKVKKIEISRDPLVLFQTIEYLRAFLMARVGWNFIHTILIISGAFGVFKRDAVVEVGGYKVNCIGEDMELIFRLQRYHIEQNKAYEITFLPEPVCWTQVPEDLGTLANQRLRWEIGMLDTLKTHKKMFFNPKYGKIGVLGYGYFFLCDVLGPIAETFGYFYMIYLWWYGKLNYPFILAYTAVFLVFGIFISLCAIILEEIHIKRFPKTSHVFLLILAAILENVGYRQLNNFWRIQGVYRFLINKKEWGEMKRKKFKQAG
jgi:cellulose synthase/poly-beta-1,6-N-acetylglucosamine synthase-like glycosyltransferase